MNSHYQVKIESAVLAIKQKRIDNKNKRKEKRSSNKKKQ